MKNFHHKGTFDELSELVPIKAILLMLGQKRRFKRKKDYIFNVKFENDILIVW